MLGYDVASYPLTDNLMQWFVFLVGTKILRRQRIPGISKRHIRVILAPTMASSLPYRVMRAFVVLFPSERLCVLTTYNILGAPPNHISWWLRATHHYRARLAREAWLQGFGSQLLEMATNAEMEALQGLSG